MEPTKFDMKYAAVRRAMILEETESAQEEPQTVIEKVPLEISDYQTLYRNLYACLLYTSRACWQ